MPPFHLNEVEIVVFGLALIRISAFFFTWPLFSQFTVSSPIKVLFSLAVTACVLPSVSRAGLPKDAIEVGLMWIAAKEAFVGLFLGFISRLLFYAIEAGGNVISTSMGLSSATVFNPASGSNSTVLEKFFLVIATLLFLALNAHHSFLTAIVESFTAVPISPTGIDLAALGVERGGGQMIQQVTIAGLKMAAPVMVVIFFLNVAMGIIGRAVPQINVLVTSLPVNIVAGLLVLVVTLPAMMVLLDKELVSFADYLFQFMRSL